MDANLQELLAGEFTRVDTVRQAIAALSQQSGDGNAGQIAELQQTMQHLQTVYKSKQLQFLPIHGGKLCLGGRPGTDKIQQLAATGIDVVVTLLRETEGGVQALGDAVCQNGMEWVWFPLSASALPNDEEFLHKTVKLFASLVDDLQAGKTVFIHCAAGIHRTGSFTNAFLQYSGYSPLESRRLVKTMREVTAREAVSKHWRWATQVVAYARMTGGT